MNGIMISYVKIGQPTKLLKSLYIFNYVNNFDTPKYIKLRYLFLKLPTRYPMFLHK